MLLLLLFIMIKKIFEWEFSAKRKNYFYEVQSAAKACIAQIVYEIDKFKNLKIINPIKCTFEARFFYTISLCSVRQTYYLLTY